MSNKPDYCMAVSVTSASIEISDISKENYGCNKNLEYPHHWFEITMVIRYCVILLFTALIENRISPVIYDCLMNHPRT